MMDIAKSNRVPHLENVTITESAVHEKPVFMSEPWRASQGSSESSARRQNHLPEFQQRFCIIIIKCGLCRSLPSDRCEDGGRCTIVLESQSKVVSVARLRVTPQEPIEKNVFYANVGAQLPLGVSFGGSCGTPEVDALPNSNGGKNNGSEYKPLERGRIHYGLGLWLLGFVIFFAFVAFTSA